MAPKPPPYHGSTDPRPNSDRVETDSFAAGSNTWRRMKTWQIAGIIVAIIVLALLLWLVV